MGTIRKPFQGVMNIVRFNWHFYLLALFGVIMLVGFGESVAYPVLQGFFHFVAGLIVATILLSLGVSYYIYDVSGLYQFDWIAESQEVNQLVNIHAGFDETSSILQQKFPTANMQVFDFYNPAVHTEPSIKRARKAYPSYPGTIGTSTTSIPLENHSADLVFVIMAAHEIRNPVERVAFFKELHRISKPGGSIYVMEHLRDLPNFMAFQIGFLHFYTRASWLQIFEKANLTMVKEQKCTPFISVFKLIHHGHSS